MCNYISATGCRGPGSRAVSAWRVGIGGLHHQSAGAFWSRCPGMLGWWWVGWLCVEFFVRVRGLDRVFRGGGGGYCGGHFVCGVGALGGFCSGGAGGGMGERFWSVSKVEGL